jgi:hypothetical protein
MKFLTPPVNMTEADIDASIDWALAEAVRARWLVATGEKEWPERRQCMIPIYMSMLFSRKQH